MNNNPLLSIVVPCYNVSMYVDRCLKSLVDQTYENLEILLIDDGSTDGTSAQCDFWERADKRVRVIHQQNQGSSLTRQFGYSIAKGDYVTFVDSDDFIDKRMYEIMLSGMINEDADIVQCGVCDAYEKDGKLIYKHRRSGG